MFNYQRVPIEKGGFTGGIRGGFMGLFAKKMVSEWDLPSGYVNSSLLKIAIES